MGEGVSGLQAYPKGGMRTSHAEVHDQVLRWSVLMRVQKLAGGETYHRFLRDNPLLDPGGIVGAN